MLWAKASQGPKDIALSHETALLLYGISDANPSRVNLTVPTSARLRRRCPDWVAINRANLSPQDIGEHEGLPVTTASRNIMDVLAATHRTDVARQSSSDALRQGLLNNTEATSLRRSITRISSASVQIAAEWKPELEVLSKELGHSTTLATETELRFKPLVDLLAKA